MLTTLEQRWRAGRSVFVPPSVVFDPRGFEVEALSEDSLARAFVEEHHNNSSPEPTEATHA